MLFCINVCMDTTMYINICRWQPLLSDTPASQAMISKSISIVQEQRPWNIIFIVWSNHGKQCLVMSGQHAAITMKSYHSKIGLRSITCIWHSDTTTLTMFVLGFLCADARAAALYEWSIITHVPLYFHPFLLTLMFSIPTNVPCVMLYQ